MSAVDSQAWREVGERLRSLGRELRAGYERQAAGKDGDTAEAGAAGGGTAAAGRWAVADGLRGLADSFDRMATTVGATVRDPAVRDAALLAARSLRAAVSSTRSELGLDPRGRPGGRPGGRRDERDERPGAA